MAASQGNLDVAIIGGGVAGLYCLYRLLRDSNYTNKNIKLFEASDHLGGRIETWSLMRKVPGKYDTGFTDTTHWKNRLHICGEAFSDHQGIHRRFLAVRRGNLIQDRHWAP